MEKKLDLEIYAETPLNHTEAPEKVVEALTKIFGPQGEIRVEEDIVSYRSSDIASLRFMKDQFRDRRVRAAARRLLVQNSTEIQTQLLFNKQAATVGIAAICDDPSESPLGPIILRLRSEQLNDVIDWLTQGFEGKDSETS